MTPPASTYTILLFLVVACAEGNPVYVANDATLPDPCEDDPDASRRCLPTLPSFVLVDDADRDADQDIFVLSQSDRITAASNGGNGEVSTVSFRSGIDPSDTDDRVLLCDVDDDGLRDILYNPPHPLVADTLWLQSADSTAWTLQRGLERRLAATTCVDIDADGRDDLVGLASGNVVAAFGGTGAAFDEVVEQTVVLPESLAAPRHAVFADVSDDAVPDLLVIPDDAVHLLVMRGAPQLAVYGGPTEHATELDAVATLAAADADGDQLADVLLAGTASGVSVVRVLASRPEDNGSVDFEGFAAVEIGIVAERLDTADFDGDGMPEILATAIAGDRAFVIDIIEPEVQEIVFEDFRSSVATGDFDGDGLADLVVLDTHHDQMQLLWNDGEDFTAVRP